MAGTQITAETPDEFLVALGERLSEKEGADTGLTAILKTHLLKATVTDRAVEEAKAAILALAGERASAPTKPEPHA